MDKDCERRERYNRCGFFLYSNEIYLTILCISIQVKEALFRPVKIKPGEGFKDEERRVKEKQVGCRYLTFFLLLEIQPSIRLP